MNSNLTDGPTQVGLTSNQTHHQWRSDIQLAQAAGIDGFALNIGPADSFSEEQLELAYAAADDTGFHLFISFDMVFHPFYWVRRC